MGWLIVNILLPISLPLGFLLLAKLVNLNEPTRSRSRLIRVVQDGQLSWIAMGFAASTTYEMFEALVQKTSASPVAVGLVFGTSALILASAGFVATLGTLFPVDDALPVPGRWAEWVVRYRLFVVSAAATGITASLYTLVHFYLPGGGK